MTDISQRKKNMHNLCVQKYYSNNRNDIIKHKTLRKAELTGRVPRLDTIRAHNINLLLLCSILKQFKACNPEKRRTVTKIDRFLTENNNPDTSQLLSSPDLTKNWYRR